ncbi:MAG: hypothetical protein F4057_03860 [Acidobacteria bacterium]|nr:hypothetical protein [Acidobacteriota bacterium]
MTDPATEIRHWSDCAVHNAPAYPPGPCDCGGFRTVNGVEVPVDREVYERNQRARDNRIRAHQAKHPGSYPDYVFSA